MSQFVCATDTTQSPATRILIRSRDKLLSFNGPPSHAGEGASIFGIRSDDPLSSITGIRLAPVYSSDGRYLALVREAGQSLIIHDCMSGTTLHEIPCLEPQLVSFSPLGTYVITWSRPNAKLDASTATTEGNLKVWSVASGTLVAAYFQKTAKKDLMQFSDDEKYCLQMVSNEVQIFDGHDLTAGIIAKVHHKGVTSFKLSPQSIPSAFVAVFTAESGGKPARVSLYRIDTGSGPGPDVNGPVASRTVFSASEAACYWNSLGSSVLVHTHTDVDKTNTSYYGATSLSLLTSDGELSCAVNQSKEGPIYAVAWSPQGNNFIVTAGNMPSHTTMYDIKGTPTFEFGSAHRNFVSFSPHGRFLVVAGFGNLAGEMDFYDTVRMKKIGSNSAHCTVHQCWSPCSRYFLTAVLAPRMNVDNGFSIFKYNGAGPVAQHKHEQMYEAMWRPAAAGVYPSRGPSPKRAASTGGVGDGAAEAVEVPKPKVVAPYRPPGATGSLVAELMRKEAGAAKAGTGKIKPVKVGSAGDEGSGKKTAGSVAKAPQRLIPGLHPSQQQKQKLQQPKASKQATTPAATSSSSKEDNGAGGASNKRIAAPAATARAAVATNTAATAPTAKAVAEEKDLASMSAEEKARRAKAIRKKLKQIEEIRGKSAAGVSLNEEQKQKLVSEQDLILELTQLEDSVM